MLRPRVRIPLWAAIAIAVAAYLGRSVIRGGDFSPDLPLDAIIAAALAFLILVRLWLPREPPPDEADDRRTDEVRNEDA